MSLFEDFEEYGDLGVYGVEMPTIPISDVYKTRLGIPSDASPKEVLRALTFQGLKERKKYSDEYISRAEYELEMFEELLYTDYILAVWDLCNFAKEKGILMGPGRGSAAGSLVLYAIGVTQIDSLKYGLYFERFVSKARAKVTFHEGKPYFDGSLLCDIDLDFEYARRKEVISYIENKYPNQTAKILTINTMSGKLCFKEVMKIVGGYSEEEADEISDIIPKEFGQVVPLKRTYEEVEKFRKFCDENPEIYRIALELEDLKKNYSVHASGIAISAKPIRDIMPVQLTKEDGLVTGVDMKWSAEIAVKFDILGLKTLNIIGEAARLAKIDWREIDFEDPFIYHAFQGLECAKGIFQIEADSQFRACKQLRPANFSELSDLLAIARPGAINYINRYVDVKNGNVTLPKIHPILDELIERSNGVILYQEQLMKIGHTVFGLTLDESEILRRIVGKKKTEEMAEWKPKIYEKAKERGVKEEVADFYWKCLDDAKDYSFNLSHAVSYASLSAITAYLKFRFPLEFYCALLKGAKFEDKPHEEIEQIIAELPNFGISLLPPSLVSSFEDFTVEGGNIRYGLSAIKGVKGKSIKALLDFRGIVANNKYEVFLAAKEAKLNIGILSALIQCGCLDQFGNNRPRMVLECQTFNKLTEREKLYFIQVGEKYNYDLLESISDARSRNLVDAKGRPVFTDSRWETFYRDYSKYKEIYKKNRQHNDLANWFFERKLLGYSYSGALRDCFEDSHTFTRISDLTQIDERAKVKVIGVVTAVVNKKGKESGNKYCKISFSDETGMATAMICNSKKEDKIARILKGVEVAKESLVSIVGQKAGDTIFVESLAVLDEKIYMKLSDLK